MRILYFAWLRTKAGLGEEEVAPPAEIATVGALVEWLKGRNPGLAEAFADMRLIRVAVNQDYAGLDHAIAAGDEIAFFPPVTGG